MNRQERVDCLNLDNYLTFYQEVKAVTTIQPKILESDLQRTLPLKSDLPLAEFSAEAFLVNRLQQARPQRAVHLDCCGDNLMGDVVDRHLLAPSEVQLRHP